MEIESKAIINEQQLRKLLTYRSFGPYNASRVKDALVKSDTYYSLVNPFIRIRTEHIINSWYTDLLQSDYIVEAALDFFDLEKNFSPMCENAYFTLKEKYTDAQGVESNIEKETFVENTEALEYFLESINFKKCFEKTKRSISFCVDTDERQLHLEIVKVNASDIYLEVECTGVDDKSESEQEAAKADIKKFFKDVLDIEEFENRSWLAILTNS